jgi:hypothetical protein
MKIILAALLVSALTAGCSTNTKKLECQGRDWAEFGYKMGAEGKSVHEVDEHRKDCGEKLEQRALKAYLDGYTRGIIEYCTYENGYALASQKIPLSQNCPLEVRGPFVKGYNVGRINLEEKIRRIDKEINGKNPTPVQNAGPTETQYGP